MSRRDGSCLRHENERLAARQRLLAAHGFEHASLAPLPVDCSFRSYVRLLGGPRPCLLMDAPPALEPLRPFVAVAEHLRRLGFSAPQVLASDFGHGFALIEDFGDATFTRNLDAGATAHDLYSLAIDLLAELQTDRQAPVIDVPPYDMVRLLAEADLFLDWYWPAARDAEPPAAARASFEAIWRALLAPIVDASPVLVLRDFHVDNLMRLKGRKGIAACGLLDFQDAVIGHPAYDLVSLLQDARRDLAPDLVAAMRQRYAAAMPGRMDESAYWILGAQRHLKVLGIFSRQSRRDGKHRYLKHIPRLWRLLGECTASEPRLQPLAEWLDRYWPTEAQVVPSIADRHEADA